MKRREIGVFKVSESASAEALRIVRSVEVSFPTGPSKMGTAFVTAPGILLNCAHVALNDDDEQGTSVRISKRDGAGFQANIVSVSRQFDLARIEAPEDQEPAPRICQSIPTIGRSVVFSGRPQGVSRSAVFPGMISDVGTGLIGMPRCEVIQIASMINSGNSGGPLLDAASGAVIGIVTAKYVPLLAEIDKLTELLEQTPQYPSDVVIGQIDFSKFVNITIRSMWQLAAVLRLVQVGTGWAVPARHFSEVGV